MVPAVGVVEGDALLQTRGWEGVVLWGHHERAWGSTSPDLPGGGGVGPRRHGGAGGLDKKEVIIQQGPSSLDTAGVKVVVEAAHVGVPEGGAMQEARGTTVQPGKPAFIVTGIRGGGAGGAHRAAAGKGRAAGRGRRRGALAGAAVLDHQVFDAVHRRVEGEVPAAGARRAPSAERVGAEGSTEAARAHPCAPAAASFLSSQRSWGAPTSEAQGGRYILSVAAEDLALRIS